MTSAHNGWNSDDSRSSSFSTKRISQKREFPSSHSSTRSWSRRMRWAQSKPSRPSSWGNNFQDFWSKIRDFFQNHTRWKILLYGIGGFFVIYLLWLYFAVATKLPVITNDTLEQGNFSQTSVMSDRNWKSLYKFYEQNRKFVNFEDIAPQAINAFIAIEDQSFWSNAGIDFKGIVRNIFNSVKRVFGSKVTVWGASTITQQLLKNILALDKNEENLYDTIVRKHKERLLVSKMAEVIKSDIKKNNPWIDANEVDRKAKERVMELYINFIYLGHQAYGIQAASQAYFGKNAADLTILEGAILGSLPQSPSYYDPYNNPDRVLGKLSVTTTDWEVIHTGDVYNQVIDYIAWLVNSSTTNLARGNSSFQTINRKILSIKGYSYFWKI